jgi:hypothetical protein
MRKRGEIVHRDRAGQVIDYSGLRIRKITPTDMDGLIEYNNHCFIFIEYKGVGIELPLGQSLALERLVAALTKPAILLHAEHSTPVEQDIDGANARVIRYYFDNQWRKCKKAHTVSAMVARFIDKYGGIYNEASNRQTAKESQHPGQGWPRATERFPQQTTPAIAAGHLDGDRVGRRYA